jgi:hypothetical protein
MIQQLAADPAYIKIITEGKEAFGGAQLESTLFSVEVVNKI